MKEVENVSPLGEIVILEVTENIATPGKELKSEGGIYLGTPKSLEDTRNAYIPKNAIIHAVGRDVPSHVNLSPGDKVVCPTNVVRIQFDDKEDSRFLIATNYKNIMVKYY